MASRFWVGGTGNWDASTTTHWAASSGGVGGQTVPTSGDTVTFDTLSNATAYTVTITATANCSDLTIGNSLAGVITFAGSSALNVFGNFAAPSGGTWTYSGTITFSATATGKTVTTNSVTLAGPVTFNGVGGGWQLQDVFNIGSGNNLTITNGALDTNGKTITCQDFSSSVANIRTITLGASTINCKRVDFNTSTSNLTFNAGTSSFICSLQQNSSWNGGGQTFNNVTLTSSSSAFQGANTFANLTVGSTGITAGLFLTANQVVTTLFTSAGSNATTGRVWVLGSNSQSGILWGSANFSITAASVSLLNTDFSDVNALGAATWSGTSIGNAGGNSNITFTTPVTRFWVGTSGGNWSSTANWSTASGSSSGASVPICHDTVIFDVNSITSGSRTITSDCRFLGTNVSFTGMLNNPQLHFQITNASCYFLGNVTLIPGMTTGTDTNGSITIAGYGTRTFSTADVVFPQANGFNFDMGTGTCNMNGDLNLSSLTGTFNLTSGIINFNNYNVTAGGYAATRNIARAMNMGNGIFTITNSGGSAWKMDTNTGNLTITGTATIVMNDATSSSKTFAGGANTYGTLQLTGAGTGTFIIQGSNTFSRIIIDTPPHTVQFTATSTNTVGTWVVNGTAGNLITLQSTTGASAWNLVGSVPGHITSNFVSIQDSHASGTNVIWDAGFNSTNVSGNTGWIFNTYTIDSSNPTQGFWATGVKITGP